MRVRSPKKFKPHERHGTLAKGGEMDAHRVGVCDEKGGEVARQISSSPHFPGADWTDRVVLVSAHSEASTLLPPSTTRIPFHSHRSILSTPCCCQQERFDPCCRHAENRPHRSPKSDAPCVGKAPGLKFSSLLGLLASHSLPSPVSFSLSRGTKTTTASYHLTSIADSGRESSSRLADLACSLQPQHCGDPPALGIPSFLQLPTHRRIFSADHQEQRQGRLELLWMS